MNQGLQAPRTRRGIAGGPTARGLAGGASRRTGGQGYNTTKRYTQGGTTSQTNDEEKQLVKYSVSRGCEINIRPKPLIIRKSDAPEVPKRRINADGESETMTQDQSKVAQGELSQPKADASKEHKEKEKEKDKTSLSMQSGLTSSLMETSEDEEAKAKAAKAKAKEKKGLTKAELDAPIHIELKETQTITLLHIPGVVVNHEADANGAYTQCLENGKKYQELLANKVGSDSYAARGSQTINLTQKTRESSFRGFDTAVKDPQATNWDIDDASKQKKVTEGERMQAEYEKTIEEIMTEKLKHPQALIDAEQLASHVSVISSTVAAAKASKASGANTSGQRGKGSNTNMQSSHSNLQQSVNQSQTSDAHSVTSNSQTATQAISSEVVGDYGKVKNVEYIDVQLPSSMLKAIRIIERLLTQTAYHEQQVSYKDYPPVKIAKYVDDDDEDLDEEAKNKRMIMAMKKGKEVKKEEEEKPVEDELKDGQVAMKKLFTFEFDAANGRQVSCMDINVKNQELIAVGYGEYDISCKDDKLLKPGMLCFWTLKNPNFPEKIIETDHSITCCQFSKKQPHLIAAGDSHGNIMIYNIRSNDLRPIAESKDLDGKHNDIVWDVKWVTKQSKVETLVSIAGDGRIIEWSMKKGLEFIELMQLKRETNPNHQVYAGAETEKKSGGMTFIQTGGLSIDFPQNNETGINYFTATEDCSVHKCSTSYSEQYLQTYYGHSGPIYKVRCNPFWHPVDCPIFLTCSYDWTVRVWNAKESTEKLRCIQIKSLQDQINDIYWNDETSSVFASVANDGRVEIWDLYRDPLAPQITHFDKRDDGSDDHTPKTVVRFSNKGKVLLTGSMNGKVDVYRTMGLEHGPVTEEEQINRIISAIKKDDYSDSATDKKKADEE